MPVCKNLKLFLNLHNKLQRSTSEVKNQTLTACLWSNWISHSSFFCLNYAVNVCAAAKFHWNIFKAISAWQHQKNSECGIQHKCITSTADSSSWILIWKQKFWQSTSASQKEMDHSCNSSDFKLYWAEAQYPACTAEYPEPIKKNYRMENSLH